VIAATEPTASTHAASDVFVILKDGPPTRVARHERPDLAHDHEDFAAAFR
jgi:hypothetical protein